MLRELQVRDFAIVRELTLEFGRGLTVLTGETGAGKSIVIDALALAMGERADGLMIREGAARAEASASFEIDPASDAARWLAENGYDDERSCVLRRVLETDRPSRAWINGRPSPVQGLRDLGDLLVDVHGQHEHQSLLKRDGQRRLLDDYAGLAAELDELGTLSSRLRALMASKDALEAAEAERASRMEFLRHQTNELALLEPRDGEIPELEAEQKRLAHGQELAEGIQEAAALLHDDDEVSVARLVGRARNRIESLARLDERLSPTVALLDEVAIQLDEAAGQLHRYLDRAEPDPERLAALDARLRALTDCARKHRVRPEELPAVQARLIAELGALENKDATLAGLETDITAARDRYTQVAAGVSGKRAAAAEKLGRDVTAIMQRLGMRGGRFEIALAPLEGEAFSRNGRERIEFLVSANPGQAARPLNKVASGGELSRVSLAIQVATARVGRIPTLVFDEVDAGIGGGVAEITGSLLRTLAVERQVLCITHLPQVAAQGHAHWRVAKRTQRGATTTTVEALLDGARIAELARMLGGVEITRETTALASDMLARVGGDSA
jgi:DNA repair protein RecN (Recombination protein N)